MLKRTSKSEKETKIVHNQASKSGRKELVFGEQPPPSLIAGRPIILNGTYGWENQDELHIDRPTDFKHVMGISSQTFMAIKAAEKELFRNMSEMDKAKSNEEISTDSFQNGNHRSRINVVQEREIHGGGYLLRTVEILKHKDETVGIAVKYGNDWDRRDGVFISRLVLGSIVESSVLVKVGDEILYVNGVDVNGKSLDEVFLCLKIPSRLLITLKIKQIGRCAYRSRESRSVSNSPRRSLPGHKTTLLEEDYRSKTIPRPSSAQANLAKSHAGRVPPLQRLGRRFESDYDEYNGTTSPDGCGPSRSRFRSATASEVLSGGSSSELSPRDTSISERDLSPTLGPEVRIQPDEDSDSMVFVDDDSEDIRPAGSFNDIQNLRKSAPPGSTSSSGVVRRPQHHRPYSTIIPPNRELLESAGVVETDERLKTSSSSLRHASSSDDIHEPKLEREKIMTRQNSSPLGSPQGSRRRENRAYRKVAGISLNLHDKQIFSIFKETTRKISKTNLRKDARNQGSQKHKYVPKPSPEKRLRRISSNKPLDIDLTQFVKYKGDPGPRSRSPLMEFSGILTLHLHGGKKMVTRKENRDLYCVVEVDSVHKAQTSVISGQDEFCWDEKFEIDLEQAHHMCIMIYSYSSDYEGKQKLCYRTFMRFNNLLTQGSHTRSKDEVYSLALRLEPRGILYATLSFTERSATLKRVPSLDRRGTFGVPIDIVVRREGSERNIPLIIQKCVQEIELRGLRNVGIYRVCGSAKKKKRLHDEFEKASALVDLSFDNFPDINIITGVLKDYLRELPEPLFTASLCERLIAHFSTPNPQVTPDQVLETMIILPPVNKETAEFLLDHLKAVDAYSVRNKMDLYNIAVCFGPVLMSRGCAMAIANGNEKNKNDGGNKIQTVDSAEKHIELLQTLLRLWPARTALAIGPPPEEDSRPVEEEEEPTVDNQEEDSCYHSNDDLDEGAAKDIVMDADDEDKEALKGSMQDVVGWDADHLEVSAC